MATFHDSTTLPKSRAALEALIDAAIARLDEMDGDPDLEPSLGAPLPLGTTCADVGRWMAEQIDRLAHPGDNPTPEFHRVQHLSQARWADCGDTGDREEECEDEGAQDDREPEEDDCDPRSEDDVSSFDYLETRQSPQAQQRKAEACQAAVEQLRGIQRRKGRRPVQPLRVLGGAVAR